MQDRIWICPIMHPAAILRGRHGDEPAQSVYLDRARQIAEEEWEPEDVTMPPSGGILFPTLKNLYEFFLDGATHETYAGDIESAGDILVCLGFARFSDEASLCIPFRKQGGGQYWSADDLPKVIKIVDGVLDNCPTVWQNGQTFDIPFLERYGFRVGNYVFDTMLGQRHAYPEMPADLQFIGGFYGKVPAWKWLVREEDEGK